MSQTVEIDEVDIKILLTLIKDARTKLKDIAKDCGLSANAIFKRVERLKAAGVITGTILFINPESFDLRQTTTIGINLEPNQEVEVASLIRKHANLIHLDTSFGKYDICAFAITKNIANLELLKQIIRKHPGITRIAVNFWDKVYFNLGNIALQPQRAEPHGRS
jgi:Lrp/AsnC family transcriptional regulator, regulator for asnA, asnC and gidA